jgi:hypothetical protein
MSGGRDDSGLEKLMQSYLASRRSSAKADADFTGRVMASVQDWERELSQPGAAGRERQARTPGRPWFTGLLFPFGKPAAWPRPVLGMAFSLLLLVSFSGLVYLGLGPHGTPEAPDITRIKGEGFRLGFQLKRDGRLTPAIPGMDFLPGDLLQAVYSAPARGRFHLFSIDESGDIHCFSCATPDTLLPAGRDRPLSYALELDASTGQEAFAGFWSESPISSDAVSAMMREAWKAAGHDLASLPGTLRHRLSPGLEASVFPIRKKETTPHGIH